MSATVSGLPADWEERHDPAGRLYYFHSAIGKSSWTRPGSRLPPGWKEMKTPDGISFYLHEELQLSTWHRPGQQPNQSKTTVETTAYRGETCSQRRRKGRPYSDQSTSINHCIRCGIAASWSASAADIASDPIAGTTRAVRKGVMLAARSLKNNKARRILNRVGMKNIKPIANAAMDAEDGPDEAEADGEEYEENEDVGDHVFGNDRGCEANLRASDFDEGSYNCNEGGHDYGNNGFDQSSYGYPHQDMPLSPDAVELQTQSLYMDSFTEQGPGTDICGQVSNPSDCFHEIPAPLINDMAVENTEASNHGIDQSSNYQLIDQNADIYVDGGVEDQCMGQSNQDLVDQSVSNQVITQSNETSYGQGLSTELMYGSSQIWVDNGQSVSHTDAHQDGLINTAVNKAEDNM